MGAFLAPLTNALSNCEVIANLTFCMHSYIFISEQQSGATADLRRDSKITMLEINDIIGLPVFLLLTKMKWKTSFKKLNNLIFTAFTAALFTVFI